jgi:hypothetical protein
MLVAVAAKRTKKPAKVVKNFLADLERRHLGSFLAGGRPDDVERRDARLRYRLDQLGCRLEKSRRRDPLHPNHAVYDVIHRVSCEINLDAPRDLGRLEKWVEEQLAATRV